MLDQSSPDENATSPKRLKTAYVRDTRDTKTEGYNKLVYLEVILAIEVLPRTLGQRMTTVVARVILKLVERRTSEKSGKYGFQLNEIVSIVSIF